MGMKVLNDALVNKVQSDTINQKADKTDINSTYTLKCTVLENALSIYHSGLIQQTTN